MDKIIPTDEDIRAIAIHNPLFHTIFTLIERGDITQEQGYRLLIKHLYEIAEQTYVQYELLLKTCICKPHL